MADVVFEGLDAFERFTAFVEKTATAFELPFVAATESISYVLEKNIRGVFGDASKLADLAPATQAERERLGYSANEPLKRDGSLLLASIERAHEGLTAGVGSSEPILRDHEFGYINARTGRPVPPRPTIEIGLKESEGDVLELVDAAVQVSLGATTSVLVEATDRLKI